MPQASLYLDLKEDEIVNNYSEKWKLSKVDVIKKIIRNFEEKE